ncbi:hypothetical protein UMM65_01570 [Aureibaculum sp. 2210JD6-5]|uniref:hypothetical protein n=1 Tax=Aureibaculum sp. 2210JD6-5 TaxID=3103957 RepID=UPI002AADC72A|nr:hypothetical protein [Aureibaculum sp. 2210JD6-5]MDY7393921.1 hypothetical protein [Aureibaculum sp. 2210JD6-5]
MKITRLFSIFLLLTTVLLCQYSYAQKEENTDKHLQYLTKEQKQLLKEQQELLDKTRAIFKENLTEAQLKILRNKSLSKEKRTELLRKTISKKQLDIISANQNLLKRKKDVFKKSLTKRQKLRLRKFINKRNINDRKRLVRRLRRLIRDNMDR